MLNVQKELVALQRMSVGQLRDKYAEVFGERTRSYHKDYLVRRIMWRLHAKEQGDLSERARHRAAELAHDADLRLQPPPRLRLTGDGPIATTTLKVAPDQRLPLPGFGGDPALLRRFPGPPSRQRARDQGDQERS